MEQKQTTPCGSTIYNLFFPKSNIFEIQLNFERLKNVDKQYGRDLVKQL